VVEVVVERVEVAEGAAEAEGGDVAEDKAGAVVAEAEVVDEAVEVVEATVAGPEMGKVGVEEVDTAVTKMPPAAAWSCSAW
jgi:hypothetical protein